MLAWINRSRGSKLLEYKGAKGNCDNQFGYEKVICNIQSYWTYLLSECVSECEYVRNIITNAVFFCVLSHSYYFSYSDFLPTLLAHR